MVEQNAISQSPGTDFRGDTGLLWTFERRDKSVMREGK